MENSNIKLEYNLYSLEVIIKEMLNSTNDYPHYEFYKWFMAFFQLTCVEESIKLSDAESDILYIIDAEIDTIIDFDKISINNLKNFKYDKKVLFAWLEEVNKINVR